MKYCLKWSVDGFGNTEEARLWVGKFVDWYNTEHKHSGIKYVTPKERHCGLDTKILNKPEDVYKKPRRCVQKSQKVHIKKPKKEVA